MFFENQTCGRCGDRLGFLPQAVTLSALEPSGNGWTALAEPGSEWRPCANAEFDVCNWLVPASSPERFCTACRHNRTVPDLSDAANLAAWGKMERAKHRLFYTLLCLGLPTPNRNDDPANGLVFDFLTDSEEPGGSKVMTGHEDGLITLAVAEADDAEREARRARMGEPYRTLLGHFRHEVGHFYWDRLIRDGQRIGAYRAIFGDESEDYGAALKRHYAEGPPAGWQQHFVSAYAASHPWEDWAESWAQYLHIVDSLETAASFGLEVHPSIDPDRVLRTDAAIAPYGSQPFNILVQHWLPLTIALNAMNQSMGLNDLYPFVLSPAVITKLNFINDVVHDRVRAAENGG